MKNKKSAFKSFFALLMAFLLFTACEPEVTTYRTYTLSIASMSGNNSDVYAYIKKRSEEINKSAYSAIIEKRESEKIFNTFCDNLALEVTTKGFRVLPDTWAMLQLSDVTRTVIAERRIEFTKNSEPKYYVQFEVNEVAPSGDEATATAFLDNLLTRFSVTKLSKTENKIKTNTYRFYQEYPTATEAETYYNNNKGAWGKVIDEVDAQWPSDVLYTGKIYFKYEYVDETSRALEEISSVVLHKPEILSAKGWVTSDVRAPFTTVSFLVKNNNIEAPYFLLYKTTLNEVVYEVVYFDKTIIVLPPTGTVAKYVFEMQSATTFKLTMVDGVIQANGALYTKQ